jgi:hypothetical protein
VTLGERGAAGSVTVKTSKPTSRRELIGGAGATLGMFAGFGLAPRRVRAQQPERPPMLVNLRLFEGRALRRRDDVDILMQDGKVQSLPPRGQGPADAGSSTAAAAR